MAIWPWRKPAKPAELRFRLETSMTTPMLVVSFREWDLVVTQAAAYHAARLALAAPGSRFEARGTLPPHEGAIAFYRLPDEEQVYVEALSRGAVQSMIWPLSTANAFLAATKSSRFVPMQERKVANRAKLLK